MLKSLIDKIAIKGHAWVWGCKCCMTRKDKPLIRRGLRSKLKIILKRELRDNDS